MNRHPDISFCVNDIKQDTSAQDLFYLDGYSCITVNYDNVLRVEEMVQTMKNERIAVREQLKNSFWTKLNRICAKYWMMKSAGIVVKAGVGMVTAGIGNEFVPSLGGAEDAFGGFDFAGDLGDVDLEVGDLNFEEMGEFDNGECSVQEENFASENVEGLGQDADGDVDLAGDGGEEERQAGINWMTVAPYVLFGGKTAYESVAPKEECVDFIRWREVSREICLLEVFSEHFQRGVPKRWVNRDEGEEVAKKLNQIFLETPQILTPTIRDILCKFLSGGRKSYSDVPKVKCTINSYSALAGWPRLKENIETKSKVAIEQSLREGWRFMGFTF